MRFAVPATDFVANMILRCARTHTSPAHPVCDDALEIVNLRRQASMTAR